MSDIEQIPDHFWDFMEDGDFTKFAKREGQMSGIVERLRRLNSFTGNEAADEIERLRKLLNTGNGVIGKTLANAAVIRAATIEECARKVETAVYRNRTDLAAAIRALKEQP